MANLTYNYVYFASGPHTRQPRSSSGPGGFTLIQTFAGGTLAAGDTFVASPQPATMPVGSETYDFAFISVSGGTGGGVTSNSSTTPAPAVTVGSANISVLVVYALTGGGPGGTAGATIDSFDISSGTLFSDTFVKVTPDPSGSLTTSGNVEGWVPSATGPLTIEALSPTSPTGVDFQYWLTLLPDASSTSPNLAVGQNKSLSALAFYKTPPVVTPPPLTPCQQAVEFLVQIIEDGDRPLLTVAQFAAVKAQLETCVAEGKLTQTEVNNLLNEYQNGLTRQTPPARQPQ
jgi:hypothetical protein